MGRFFLHFLCISLLLGCTKDEVIFIPDLTNQTNQDVLTGTFTDLPESYLLDYRGVHTVFPLPSGVIIEIPAASLFSTGGNPIQGEVKLELQYASKQKKSLLRCPSLLSETGCIDCEKLVFVRILHNGRLVEMTKPIHMYLPADAPQPTRQLFSSEKGMNNMLWSQLPSQELVPDTGIWQVEYNKALIACEGYRIQINQAEGWYCVGRAPVVKWSEGSGQCIGVPSGYSPQNTIGFFISTESNTSFRLEWDGSTSCLRFPFTPSEEKLEGKIVTLSHFGGDSYHFGMTRMVWQKESTLQFHDIHPATQKEIQEALDAL